MMWSYLLMTLLMVVGVLLIIIVLLQRGRGGGLAGAFGGAGGQSALGTKAGDVFTKITIVMACLWVGLAGVCIISLRASTDKFEGGSQVGPEEPALVDGEKAEKSDEESATKEMPAEETSSDSPAGELSPEAPAEKAPAGDAKATGSSSTTSDEPKNKE